MANPRHLPPGPLGQHDEIEPQTARPALTNLFEAAQPWAPSTEPLSTFDMALFVFMVVGLAVLVLRMAGI